MNTGRLTRLFSYFRHGSCCVLLLLDFISAQYNIPFGEGLSGLDVSILHEIAVALDPSMQAQQHQRNSFPSVPGRTNTPASGGTAPTCTGKDGFFPDYAQNCKVYYRCSPSGRMARFECPLNFAFSEQTKKCDIPERVTCAGSKPVETASAPSIPHTRAILPDSSILTSLAGGSVPAGIWPGSSGVEGTSGFYEPLSGSAFGSPVVMEGLPSLPTVKIMGDPRPPLDMDPDICFGRPNQYVPDADTGCRGYVLCPQIFGRPMAAFFCPQGMRFDTKAESCMPKGNVRCIESERLFPANLNPNFNANGVPGTANLFPSVLEPATLPPPVAQDPLSSQITTAPCWGKTGFVPDYAQQCRVYYYCNADGSTLNLTCQAEMVFNPSLQSCDFMQTGPECRAPGTGSPAAPQKMAPEGTKPQAPEQREPVSPWSYSRHRSLLPLQQGSPGENRPLLGGTAKSSSAAPALLTMPTLSHRTPPSVSMPSILESRISGYAPLSRTPPQINFHERTMLEGFGAIMDPILFHNNLFANRVNTGNPFPKESTTTPSPKKIAKQLGQTNPGAPITVYETECDGSVNYYIEPESACRIYHHCHANMTMETFSCPPGEFFVLSSKSCVPFGFAVCIDALSSDAKDILHRTWEATTLPPAPALVPSTQFPVTGTPAIATQPVVPSRPINSAPEPQCTPGITGLYGDVSANCVKYYECTLQGHMIMHSCPLNLKFNNNLKACDWPEYLDGNCNEAKPQPLIQESMPVF